ncbi:DUF1496 domain-containing protein [Flavobacterium sp. F339]|uniref:DUF1496 domain-containing protein n=1 Tax=Flavobacterium turcicum TaxID=2764718 RepID=A0ABR7JBK8_9FLAO|nr:DUF1496 domain-containing protein [Flavobacterium turcicum]NHL00599.1 DUF1496 domain-containing protein [Flavobacterium turcicum]
MATGRGRIFFRSLNGQRICSYFHRCYSNGAVVFFRSVA